jgi:hypothetical protein
MFFLKPKAQSPKPKIKPPTRPHSNTAYLFFDEERLREDFRAGTLAPLRRDSFNAIAIACLRLRTVRPDPLFSVPRFRRRIADSTFFDADLPYFAMAYPPE